MIIALKSLKKYTKYIENMFELNITNGLIESLNNKKEFFKILFSKNSYLIFILRDNFSFQFFSVFLALEVNKISVIAPNKINNTPITVVIDGTSPFLNRPKLDLIQVLQDK